MATDKETKAGPPTWREMQKFLADCKTRGEVMTLINMEKSGPNRPLFISRMMGRYRVLRNAEEDAKLAKMVGAKAGE